MLKLFFVSVILVFNKRETNKKGEGIGNKVTAFYHLARGFYTDTRKEYSTLNEKEIMYINSFKSLL